MAGVVDKRKKKKILFFILAVIVIGLGVLIFRLLNPGVGFRYYEPSYLPPNVSIKALRISINAVSTAVEQDFRTVDWVYEIQEYKADTSIGTAQQNYNPASAKPTCSILTSSMKQQYRLCHWIDYGRINVHEVIFIKDGTYIRSDIPTTLQQPISIQQIGKYVDSITQKGTTGLPVLQSNV
jgi:hypothetical protein